MSPALNGSSVIRHLECSDAIKICDGIILDFYTGLPHMGLLTLVSWEWPGRFLVSVLSGNRQSPPSRSRSSHQTAVQENVTHLHTLNKISSNHFDCVCSRTQGQDLLNSLVHAKVLSSLHQEHVFLLVISPNGKTLGFTYWAHNQHLGIMISIDYDYSVV